MNHERWNPEKMSQHLKNLTTPTTTQHKTRQNKTKQNKTKINETK